MLKKIYSILIISILCDFSSFGKDSPGSTLGPENGHLIIAGGNLQDTNVFNLFIRLAGGQPKGTLPASCLQRPENSTCCGRGNNTICVKEGLSDNLENKVFLLEKSC